MTIRLGVLASGAGTNLEAILDAIHAGRLNAQVATVISNHPFAPALKKALRAGVEAHCVDQNDHKTQKSFETALLAALGEHEVEWLVLAGFMRLLSPRVIDAYPRSILNIHPALLPAFPGLNAPAQALSKGVKISGCTVHIVDYGVDTGPILAQAAVPVHPGDDLDSLTARIQIQERVLYPRVIHWISEGRLCWKDGRPFFNALPHETDQAFCPPLSTGGAFPPQEQA